MSIRQKLFLFAFIVLVINGIIAYACFGWFRLTFFLINAGTVLLFLAIWKYLFTGPHKGKGIVELNKVNHLYAFISQINQDIVRVKDEETLFKNACRIALEFGGFRMAWMGVLDSDNLTISLVEQSGVPDEVIPLFTNAQTPPNGPQGHVLKKEAFYICNDVWNDPELLAWRPFATKYNLRSCMVLPVKRSGKIVATLNLYSSELNFAKKEEINLLVEVADDISFALDLFEKERVYQQAQQLIIQNEKRFRILIENSDDMIALANIEGELIYGSPSITKVLGYLMDELLNMPVFAIIHPLDLAEFIENRNKILEEPGKSFYYQQRRRHKNGHWVWCEGSLTNLLQEPGINAMVSNFRDVSGGKLIEQQREFDKNNLNALINNTDDLMWSVDTKFDLITSNKPFEAMIELMTGEKISKGSNVLEVSVSADQSDRYKKNYERAFAGESFSEIEYTPLPVELWSEISYCPIRADDIVIGTACHSRNITALKKAMLQLSKSEAFNSGVLNSLTSNIAVIDEFGKLVAVNRSWKRFSLKNGETNLKRTGVGSNYFEICERSAKKGDRTAAQALEGIRDVMEGKVPVFYFEYPCHGPGQQRWFGMRVMKFESDEPMVVVAHQNITELKLAEKHLFQSESRLTEAQSIAHIGNFEVDIATNSEVWSEEMYKIYGANKNEVTPSKGLFLSFIHPDDRDYVKAEMDGCIKTFKTSAVNFRFIRKDGKLRYGYSEARFELGEQQRLIRIYGIFQDVTDSKLAEIERTKIVNDLMVRNKDLEQFGYIISHNLRAPVANILGSFEALKDPDLDQDEKVIFNEGIGLSINKLDSVVKDLNLILEVKSEINEPKEVVSFSGLVEDIKISIANLISDDLMEIKYDFSEANEFFSIKPYLYSIFYNLISNSVKYRKPQIKTIIEIKSHLLKSHVELTFSDNGTGIDLTKNSEQVFGLYRRFHPQIEGKGMGLFMVKTQVENLGGRITIKSKPNKGTIFKITFEV